MEDSLAAAVQAAMDDAVTMERLRSLASQLSGAADDMQLIYEADPEVAPEIHAALKPIAESLAALRRVGKFLEARAAARAQSLTEGGPTG